MMTALSTQHSTSAGQATSHPLSHQELQIAECFFGRPLTREEIGELELLRAQTGAKAFFAALLLGYDQKFSVQQVTDLLLEFGIKSVTFYFNFLSDRSETGTLGDFLNFASNYRSFLQRIAGSPSTSQVSYFEKLPAIKHGSNGIALELFKESPEDVTLLFERFGSGARALLSLYGENAPAIAQKYSEYYSELFDISPRNAYYTFMFSGPSEQISRGQFDRHHQALIAIARLARDSTPFVFAETTGAMLDGDADRLIELAILFKSDLGLLLRSFGDRAVILEPQTIQDIYSIYCKLDQSDPGKLGAEKLFPIKNGQKLVEALPRLKKLFFEFGSAASGLIKRNGLNAVHLTKTECEELGSVLKSLPKNEEESFANLLDRMDLQILKKRPGFYKELLVNRGYEAFQLLTSLEGCQEVILSNPRFVLWTAKKLGSAAGQFLQEVDIATARLNGPAVRYIVNAYGIYSPVVINHLIPLCSTAEIETYIESYGAALPALVSRFGKRFPELEPIHHDTVQSIRKICTNSARQFLSKVPPSLWSDPRMLDALSFFGEATGQEFALRQERLFSFRDAPHFSILEYAKMHFGIQNFNRLVGHHSDGAWDTRILERNIENFRTAATSLKPLFVHVLPRSDWNGAFQNAILPTEVLNEIYNILYVEAGDSVELLMHLRRLASLRGVDTLGAPLHLIDHLTLSQHSNSDLIDPGTRTREERIALRSDPSSLGLTYIHREDISVWEEIGQLMAYDSALVFDGCLTARGGASEVNVATRFKQINPHVTVIGSCGLSGVMEYRMDHQKRRIVDAIFNYPIRPSYRLDAPIQPFILS